jgi:nucleoside-diphosphate-sugar epimerase
VERLLASNAKAKERLGWSPKYKGFEGLKRGLEKTIAWFSEPGRLAQYKADVYNL